MAAIYRPRPACEPTPQELAEWVGGCLVNASQAPGRLTGMGTLDTAEPSEFTFISDAKRAKGAETCRAGLFITPFDLDLSGRARLEVKHVWSAVATIMNRLYPEATGEAGVHPTAVVGRDVELGADVTIEAHSVVGDGAKIGRGVRIGPQCSIAPGCVIGNGSRLHAGVALQGEVRLGRNVVLHPGVVLGADGFRYEAGPMGVLKIPQVGAVILEDEVEVGANSTIDRAFIHETRIGYGTKIDNQVQIGHNCTIGKFCLICGCVGIAGSVTIGDGVVLGGGVGVRDGIKIGSGAQIAGASQVVEDAPPGAQLMGYTAFPIRNFIKSHAYFRRLPELARRLAALERGTKGGGEPET